MNHNRILTPLLLLGCSLLPSCSSVADDEPFSPDLLTEFEAEMAERTRDEAGAQERRFLDELRSRLRDAEQRDAQTRTPRSGAPGSAPPRAGGHDEQKQLVDEAYAAYREHGEIPPPLLARIRAEREVAFDGLVRALLSDPTTPLPTDSPLLRLDPTNPEDNR